jgi:hypothetical protein
VDVREGLRWAALQALAAYVTKAYVHCVHVGAGDAYHYSLSMADFISQVRGGGFPAFIGQSVFAFNGGIHTIRTAPYFVHLGAAIDALTLRTLPAYAVANLAIVFSASLGVLGAYSAMRLYAPRRPTTACVLAGLFILSPAILAPLYEGDMIATFMTVTMVSWWVLGLALAADNPAAWRPWILQSAALAAMWWAHPPIALWATALTIGGWTVILARERARWSCVERMTAAALLLLLLAGYEFVSVQALGLTPNPAPRSAEAEAILANVRESWKASLLPVSGQGYLLGDIQLGYPLIAAMIAGIVAARSRKSAAVIVGCMAALIVLLVPIPGVTARLWSMVPHAELDVTNAWPMQRFYPLLAALAAFAALSAAPLTDSLGKRGKAVLALVAAACLAWSLSQAHTIIRTGEERSASEAASAQIFRPENVILTRVSYMFFGFYPGYFSHSRMDPLLETRLIDASTMEVIADGSTTISGRPPPGTFDVDLIQETNGSIQPEIPLMPGQTAVLRFDFMGREPQGTLQLIGRSLYRDYALPTSGAAKSFGSAPGNGRVIAIQNTNATADSIRLNYLPGSYADIAKDAPRQFARVTIEPADAARHVIELRSLVPFHASVTADRPAVLETPRVHIPGYRATVNGRPVAVLRTAEGLVGVPVEAGTNDVIVDYPGTRALRWAYGVSAGGWLLLCFCGFGLPLADPAGDWRRRLAAPGAFPRRLVRSLPILALVFILMPLCALWAWPSLAVRGDGAIRLVVRLPVGETFKSEPLVTTGRTLLGDVIFVNYLGKNRVSVGHDFWGRAPAVSKPITINFLVPQVVEISMESLARPKRWWSGRPATGPYEVSVKWNGQEILSDGRGSNPPGPEQTEIGSNLIGASTCGTRFSGEILESEAIEPWKQ